MAGLGRKVFNAGEVLSAANVQGYLQDQVVQVYSGTAARSSALGTAVSEGMMSYLTDSNELSVYTANGTAAWSAVNLAQSPNALINADFAINQRNASSSTLNDTFVFDRWRMFNGDGTVTMSSQPFTTGSAPVAGYESKNFCRMVSTGQTSTTANSRLVQNIEGVRTFAGQTVTVSFFAKADSGTPKAAIELAQIFGSGGSPSAAVNNYVGQVSLTTSWARYSLTIALPSLSGKTLGTDNNDVLRLAFWLSAGTDFNARTGSLGIQSATIDIWGVQLEAGSVATPFRRSSPTLQGELAACQRYYERITTESAYAAIASGKAYDTGALQMQFPFKVTKRVKPSSIDFSALSTFGYETGGTTGNTPTSISLSNCSSNIGLITVGKGASFVTGAYYWLQGNNNTDAFVGFSSEL